MGEPSVRARHLKQTLAAVDRTPARAAVRGALAPDVLAAIEASHGFDWLPVGHDVALVRAIHGALGPEGHHAFSRATILEAFDGPLLGPLIRVALAVKGRDPAGWVRWIPKAWALMFRDCGSWSVDRIAPDGAELTLDGMPAACFDDPVWPGSVASSLSALLAGAGAAGETRLVARDPGPRRARYAFRWEPAAPR